MLKNSRHSKKTKQKQKLSALKQFKDGMPEETKEKIRKKMKVKNAGKNNPMSGTISPMRNKKHTEKAKEKNRQSQIGKKHTKEHIEKNRIASTGKKNGMYGRTDEKCPGWKGDNASIDAMHAWVKRHLGKADKHKCVGDGIHKCNKQAHHWSNKDHAYKRVLKDYSPRCSSCHVKYDNKYN